MTATGKAWKCAVCGYVHRGDSAPEVCPVCGASPEDFEAYETPEAPATPKTTQWRCLICGYVHDSDNPPDVCPLCGAAPEEFEACEPAATASADNTDTRRIVIVGGGIAGVSAAESARQTLPHAEITLIAGEPDLPYYRLNLTRRLAGEIDDQALVMHPQGWYDEHNIFLITGARVESIERDQHRITAEDGRIFAYDKLILACGSHPFIPPFPGADLDGVTAVRTLPDVHQLLDRISKGAACVCIGGGILGLETAGALAKHGANITLLEGFEYLLPRQLNREAAEVLEDHVKSMGIMFRFKAVTKTIEGTGKVDAVVLEDGTRLPADAVTITTGVRANSHLARKAGLTVNQGIVVDGHMATSDPDIFAAGDCAEYAGVVAGLWEPAQYQGAIAGLNAAGAASEFGGIPRVNTLKVLGVKVFSMGVIQPDDGSYREIVEKEGNVYRRFLLRDNALVGAILVGDTSLAAAATKVARERADCSALCGPGVTVNDAAAFLARFV